MPGKVEARGIIWEELCLSCRGWSRRDVGTAKGEGEGGARRILSD